MLSSVIYIMPKIVCMHSMSECLYFWFLIIILNVLSPDVKLLDAAVKSFNNLKY